MSTDVESFRFGQVTVTRVQERLYTFPIANFMPAATPERLTPHLDWLAQFGVDDVATMAMPVNGYVVESEGRRILVDTCVGVEHSDSEPTSPFIDRLRGAGFAPAALTWWCARTSTTTTLGGTPR